MRKYRRWSNAAGSAWQVRADLEARLVEAPLMAGDRFSVADTTMIVTLDFATKDLSLQTLDTHVASQGWYASVVACPSIAA